MSGNGKNVKEQAVEHYRKELMVSKIPEVLSSYMSTDSLPEKYKKIDEYVRGIKKSLIAEAGGELSQIQMIVLDGICETLILSKYITTYISEDIGGRVVATNKLGATYLSEITTKGFVGLQTLLDKKIKQFKELIEVEKESEEEAGYMRAVMGKVKHTGKVKTGR
ncbi:hypothetical protein E3J48_02605 [Candidatus Aerophobetes bacterium]|uniref:Uncharacterized protein n=1 Tax=Aerophobetes bacterium TaxID=2030807 RepID=A0A523W8N1_UNCAE|nr:MAG: hypothetical protein E3J48_02605 [Candidatus Aerophobetes bacterium]